jgi:D-3-phosphoglycerate dehydrogenase
MKILRIDLLDLPYSDEEIKMLSEWSVVKESKSTLEEELIEEVKDVDILIAISANTQITRKIIEAGENLKAIIRYGAGVDKIDIVSATEKGIMVVNIPDYCISEVSDHTIALILSLVRRIPHFVSLVKKGDWLSTTLTTYRLKDKTLGIIGFGKIGKEVARKMHSFGLKIIVYDPFINNDIAEKFNGKKVSLEKLLKESDIVTLHCPLTKETKHLINKETLRIMKKNCYLINTSRGGLVDESALYYALRDGWIACAAMDVLENEPPDQSNPLLEMENVIITPHIAWSSPEAIRQLEFSAVEEIIRIIKGDAPNNIVNKQVLMLNNLVKKE